ncbi:MAG: HD domain-containing protein [bacterium]|nr:HD domain-containing protein [bacterium]
MINVDTELRNQLIKIAKEKIPDVDASHDFEHALRVLTNAQNIVKGEGGDLDVIVPAALFHDLVVYQKNHPEKHKSQEESAEEAQKILNSLEGFPKQKIEEVKNCILECSFSKSIQPKTLESKIIQDSDGLEATGAISIMRTFSSTGQMKRAFYNSNDPFCENREVDALTFGLDLFFERLLMVADRMHTKTARKIAERRTEFLKVFLEELKIELEGK